MTSTSSPTLAQSFEALASKLGDPDFLNCRGLGNEVPFHVLPYNAAQENEVRARTTELLAAFAQNEECEPCTSSTSSTPASSAPATVSAVGTRLSHFDLWETICALCEERGLMDKLSAFEQRRGSDALLARVQKIAAPEKLVAFMHERLSATYGEPEPGRDVLLITGVGKAYPIVRAHQILECAQPVFAHIPLVLLYPGVYDGTSLRLFGSISDGNYYRAFNLI